MNENGGRDYQLFIGMLITLFFSFIQSQLEQFEFEKQALLSENAFTHHEVKKDLSLIKVVSVTFILDFFNQIPTKL